MKSQISRINYMCLTVVITLLFLSLENGINGYCLGATTKSAEDLLALARDFESKFSDFTGNHGYKEFRKQIGSYLVNSPLLRAAPRKSGDRLEPRRVLNRFSTYARDRREEVNNLQKALDKYSSAFKQYNLTSKISIEPEYSTCNLSGAFTLMIDKNSQIGKLNERQAHHQTILRIYDSLLNWLDFQYELLEQDCSVALQADEVLFEQPTDREWKPGFSPGVFSILVRGPDIKVLDGLANRVKTYDVYSEGLMSEIGLPPKLESFVEKVLLKSILSDSRDDLYNVLKAGCKNRYEILYWHRVLELFEKHPEGEQLFERICRMAVRKDKKYPTCLYQRLRETSFPGNSECIWPRVKMSRFDQRIFAIADAALDSDPIREMEKIQEQIHTMRRQGKLRGGGIAAYKEPGRPHGLNDFLDYGVGGCEAFSSFITAPLLSLGNENVHPVFLSRPYQPWGHWIAGIENKDELYVCDGANVNFGPPRHVQEHLAHMIRTARREKNRYICIRVYSQTLDSWEWEYFLEGAYSLNNIRKRTNPVYAKYKRAIDSINR